ncbi:MAG: transporter substrate-binding domain-containing protein [Bacteroidota bacterium]
MRFLVKTNIIFVLFLFFGIKAITAQESNITPVKDTLIVGYNIDAPFIFMNNEKFDGVSYWLWKNITKDDDTFYKYEYHPLDSLLIGLSNGSIDIGLSPLTLTSQRSKYIDFSPPYYISNSTGLTKGISTWLKIKTFISSFSVWNFLKVLGSLFILLGVFGFLVWIFERKKNEKEFGKGTHGIWNGIWWSAVTMTTVGYGDKAPKTIGGRLVGLIWMFAAIILISSITAGITSSLTVEKLTWNKEDISYFDEITIGTVMNSATEQWLTDHYYENLKTYHTFEELVEGIKKDEVDVVAYDEPPIRHLIKNDPKSNLEILNLSFNESMYSMGFSKKMSTEKKKELSIKILEFTESHDWDALLLEYDLLKDK